MKNIQKVGNEWEQRNHAYALPSETIRRLLDNAILDLLKNLDATGKYRRLVVIIDDLDRCQPIVAYKLLEGLKIFLNLPSCAFLIGINRKEVERAIRVGLSAESEYENGSLPENMPREYYEKLCSHSWDIPFPTSRQSYDYLVDLLHRALGSDRLAVADEIAKQLRDDAFAHSRLIPANPRRIKAYSNNLAIMCWNTSDDDAPTDAPLLLVIAYITTFLPELNRHLLANPRCLFDLQARARSIHAPILAGNPDAVEAPRETTHDKDPFKSIIPDPDAIRYAAPEDPAIFRIAPLLARMATITEPQIKRYLPYAEL